ncbi:Ldh family oxidoreductase [Tropicimonas sp. S265A]|uniref:Ldh family oxidoreductase n=1 Tax=Tropicimonas sp. S265A TaxID=3415134 RepID=UPI003C7D54CA
MSDDTETLSLNDARALVRDAFLRVGVPEAAAQSVASALVAAEAEGQVGHGFSRLEDYVAQVRSGKIIADAEVAISQPAPGLINVDAGYGFAFPALDAGIARGIEVARTQGTAAISIARSHHCGALSVSVEKIARAGLVGLMVANSPVAIAPWGAKTPLYGTNPIAFSAPRSSAPPLVIDLSLSRVARGKVLNAKKAGKPIPEGWALDADGQPTTDAQAALKGSMQPIGGPKGTALALMVEVLSTVMTGANFSADAGSFFTADGTRPGVGHFLTLYRPPQGIDAFAARLETLLEAIAAMDGARLPGSRRLEAIARAERDGLRVPVHYLRVARNLAGVT